MKKLLLLLVTFCVVHPAFGAFALVNTAKNDITGTFNTIATGAQNISAGNLVVVTIQFASAAGTSTSVSGVVDTGSANTFHQCTGAFSVNGTGNADIWYAWNTNAISGDVITVNLTASYSYLSVISLQYSGALKTGTPFEIAKQGTATSTSVTSASFSPAASGNLNVAVGTQNVSGSNLWSAGTNYALQVNSGTNGNSEAEDRESGTPSGAQTAAIGFSSSSAMNISVASFKPAPTTIPRRRASVVGGD